jgi:hypothetical protein
MEWDVNEEARQKRITNLNGDQEIHCFGQGTRRARRAERTHGAGFGGAARFP